jgi:hypothetical protein
MDTKQLAAQAVNKQDFDKALELYSLAITEDIKDPENYYQMAIILAGKREYASSLTYIKSAIGLDPMYGGYQVTYGAVLGALGDTEGAREAFERGIQLSPGCAAAHWNLSLSQLCYSWMWREGWNNYRYRVIQKPGAYVRHFLPKPDLMTRPDATLLVHAEQGLGDTILGVGVCGNLKNQFGTVILECQKELVNLLKDHPFFDIVYARPGDSALPFAAARGLSLMDMFYTYRLEPKNFPKAWITPDPSIVAAFKEKLPTGLNVGVCWCGSRSHSNDARRSMDCDLLKPLAMPGVNLFNLSKEDPTFEMLCVDDFISDARYTAAFCETLDVIVTVDTFIANLCGAMGKECIVMHPYIMEWRWHHQPDIYASCKNIRQTEIDSWDSVISEVTALIKSKLV